MTTSLGSFADFLASAKEIGCEEFYASHIAKESCIDPSWFDKEASCFTLLDGEHWFAKFDSEEGGPVYWTMVEKDERWGDLPSLARWVFDWVSEENNDHLR